MGDNIKMHINLTDSCVRLCGLFISVNWRSGKWDFLWPCNETAWYIQFLSFLMNKTSNLLTVMFVNAIHKDWVFGHSLLAATQNLLGSSLCYFKY